MSRIVKKTQNTNPALTLPEKKNWAVLIAFWIFVLVAIAGITAMIITSPREGQLVCRSVGQTSLTGFGNCEEEKP